MEALHKIEEIIENAIDDFSSKWSSHVEKDSGITEYANEIASIIESETAQLKADKEEMLEMLELIADGTAVCNTTGKIWSHWLTEIESLIQKMKQ